MSESPRRQWNHLVTVLQQFSALQAPVIFIIVIGMLIMPMSGSLLDLFLIVNILLTFTILMRTTVVTQPLEFSVFPSLLLITTLFRLALNISATRLILSNADAAGAGQVIHAFGTFVISGNPIVGVVIFIILIVIQFVVITAGAGRVAEVAARFTLDAMPGKQMAIDADLNAGLIDEQDARRRRENVGREADFYGAMDGASKFVRGDAIAAIIMIIINILGGFAVGIGQHNLTVMDALQQYTVKTVGEGIVTQIPALIMSIATGLIVTRSTSESNLGQDLSTQLFQNWQLFKPTAKPEAPPPAPHPRTITSEEMMDLLTVDPIEVEIGYGLISLADPAQGGDLLERITSLRKQIALDLGFVVPPVRVRDNIQLKSTAYVVKLWGAELARGEILPRYLLAMNPGNQEMTLPDGIPTTEPAFGLPAQWINESMKLEAETSGFTVVDPTTVLITHLSEVVKSHAHEVLTRQDVQGLIDKIRTTAPALIDDLVPKLMSLSEVHRVLQELLKERVSIRNMTVILSALGDRASGTRDLDQLVEFVRQALARTISNQFRNPEGIIDVFTLDPSLEEYLLDHLRPTQFGTQVVLDPSTAQRLLLQVKEQAERAIALGNQPTLICSSQVRPYLRRLVEKYLPSLIVISHAEVVPGIQVRSSGTVSLS